MIFGSLMRRAETAVESILDQALARVVVALPLLVAGGFATAAASAFLNAKYGPQLGNLAMAGVFSALGLVAALIMSLRKPWSKTTMADVQSAAATAAEDTHVAQEATPMSQSEKEMFQALLASAAPIAIPGVMRLALRNIPLVLLLGAIAYVFTRGTGTGRTGTGQAANETPPANDTTANDTGEGAGAMRVAA